MEPEIKVTRIKNRWHSRLFFNNKIIDEMACECSNDIGFICREMLRWFDKLGGESNFASQARKRQTSPIGKIWYKRKLDEEKKKG